MRWAATTLTLALASGACSSPEQAAPVDPFTLTFRPEQLESGSEEYLCFGFDAASIAGLAVERIAWSAPASGGVALHHAILYAMQSPFPKGPLSCRWMPDDAVGIHIWGPGTDPLVMPEGFALSIPETTTLLVVQAHVLRSSDAPAAEVSVALNVVPPPADPNRLAGWHATVVDVPEIAPHAAATATSSCKARADAHTLFVWPHMHALGATFHGAIQRASGETIPLVDIADWNVDGQQAYPIEVDIGTGDVIETTCTWENPGDAPVVGGLWTTDEMCTQSLIWWPAEARSCERLSDPEGSRGGAPPSRIPGARADP